LNPESLPEFVRTLLTPMFMVTGAASMNWGLQRIHFTIVNRLHALNDERLELQHAPNPTAQTRLRLGQIREQLQLLACRARYTRNSIASFYLAILAFLICSVSIAVVGRYELPAAWICTSLFLVGMATIYMALVFTLLDVRLSYRAVLIDSQTGGADV
jgi:hypothetical protein